MFALPKQQAAGRGKRIQEIVSAIVAAKAPVTRRVLVGDHDDRWLHDLFAALCVAGVVVRSAIGGYVGKRGPVHAFAISNWHAAQQIVDATDHEALYERWVVHPPQRKLPNGATNGHGKPDAEPPPTAPAPEPTAPSLRLSPAALAAIKTLVLEGVL